MAGADVGGGGGQKRHQKKGRRPKKRMKVRIDMTPLVDVAFLLLTFFMLTTVFRLPNALEIVLPETKNQTLDIAESKMITIRVGDDMVIYWNKGFDVPQKMAFDKFPEFVKARRAERTDWIIKVIVDRKAKSHALIDIVDKLIVNQLDRFTIVPITEIDKKEMARAI